MPQEPSEQPVPSRSSDRKRIRRADLLRPSRIGWAIAALTLLLIAWQGHRLERILPWTEQAIERSGPWGPLATVLVILVLGPLLVPETIFGIAAGFVLGLRKGGCAYFAGVYLMCLLVQWLGRRWLHERVVRLVATRPRTAAIVSAAPEGGTRFLFLLRLVPLNPALVSYALGAANVPLRFALVGNLGMLLHMVPTVYFGATAAHLTRRSREGHHAWELREAALIVGLLASVVVTLVVSRRAWAAISRQQRARGAARSDDLPS